MSCKELTHTHIVAHSVLDGELLSAENVRELLDEWKDHDGMTDIDKLYALEVDLFLFCPYCGEDIFYFNDRPPKLRLVK